jgi:FtsH-binding integral membrane protein
MRPPSEHVHWLFAAGVLFVGLCLLARAIVGVEVWDRRAARAYLWPALLFTIGLLMWPVMVFFTNSAIHMLAHGSWAQAMMLAGAAHLGLARGKLTNRYWRLTLPIALIVSGAAFLVHEQNGWLWSRSAFVHHAAGWTLVVAALFPLLGAFLPRRRTLEVGFALTVVALAVIVFSARDVAPIFGHLSSEAGIPKR